MNECNLECPAEEILLSPSRTQSVDEGHGYHAPCYHVIVLFTNITFIEPMHMTPGTKSAPANAGIYMQKQSE